ncbi:MAG: hypothetical protein UIB61_06500 [Treponema sp.]|nr:hypothetical protein [Treponema sp.]
MIEIDFKTYEKINKKLEEVSDISSCVKDVITLLNCSDLYKVETLLRLEEERIDELLEIVEELKGEESAK